MNRIPLGMLILVLGVAPALAEQAAGPAGAAAGPRVLSGTPDTAFSTIQVTVLDAGSEPLANAPIRLRDARVGRIVSAQLADRQGQFVFRTVDPGSYVVELLSADGAVLAASPILNVNAGDVVSTVLKLPRRPAPLASLLGNNTAQAAVIAAAAATAGILAQAPTNAVSPERPGRNR
jgi:hypothetical protein